MKCEYVLAVLIIGSLFSSCKDQSSKTPRQSGNKTTAGAKPDIRKKPGSGFHDSLIITTSTAVFFEPDSVQMEKIRSVNEPGIFESLTHECYYQMRNARLVIQRNRPDISIKAALKVRWLIFKKSNGSITVDLDEINNICGIYLFDGVKDPIRVDMTNIDSELGFYFRKQ